MGAYILEESDDVFWMTTNRIETLVDGIFAIAMTLLILSLAVPEISSPLSNAVINNVLSSLYPKFFVFVLSFILLAVFWSLHHRAFHYIKKANNIFLWLNIIWLLFIVMVPFSQTFIGKYGGFTTSELIYTLNLMGIAIFMTLIWYYAVKKQLISKNISKKRLSKMSRDFLVFVFVAFLAVIMAFILPEWATLTYMLIIPLAILVDRL